MNKRFEEIFSSIPTCSVFADIGCDHGYISKAMLERGKAKKVLASDISEKCLEKAKDLLKEEIALGKAECIVSNGFDNLSGCDCALIAGMGGEEIILILKKAKTLPENLILQPMKNTDKVRVEVVKLGYQIQKDYLFTCGKKHYDLLVLSKGEDSLSAEEIEFGRTNLQNPSKDFKQFIELKINGLQGFLKNDKLSFEHKKQMLEEIERLKKYV